MKLGNSSFLITPMLTALIIDEFLTAGTPQSGAYSVPGLAFSLLVLGGAYADMDRKNSFVS